MAEYRVQWVWPPSSEVCSIKIPTQTNGVSNERLSDTIFIHNPRGHPLGPDIVTLKMSRRMSWRRTSADIPSAASNLTDNSCSKICYCIHAIRFILKDAKSDADAMCKYRLDLHTSGKCKLLYVSKEKYPLHSFQDSVWQLKCIVARTILLEFISVTHAKTSSMPRHTFCDLALL